MQNERESDKEADEEERNTLTVSWCHLAKYLSSKVLGWASINSMYQSIQSIK